MTRTLRLPPVVLALAIAGLSVVALAGGCETTRAVRPERLLEPVPLPTPQIAQGQVLFMRYCHTCHPDGGAGLGTSLVTPLPDAVVRAQVRVGGGGMPRFSEEVIGDDEVSAIIAYLDTLREHVK